ncbi:MAG: hypothetical protein HY880_05330 [Deltaproteobacteria bacterium]|nr:hypothetical protein [Deltaproteobacteria bacterium]
MADEKDLDPRYSGYPQRFHRYWPRHVIKGLIAAFIVIAGLSVLSYYFRVPTNFDTALPDDGMYIPGPEWYFLFILQPFWYFTGDAKKWLALGTFVAPIAVILSLILIPFVLGRKKREPRRGLRKALAMVFVFGVWGALFFGLYSAGAPSKLYGCLACHTPAYGERQYLPPMDVAEYYNINRSRQIQVGKYRASKSDTAGDAIYTGVTVETYKDANWQLRHFYEPTFTW